MNAWNRLVIASAICTVAALPASAESGAGLREVVEALAGPDTEGRSAATDLSRASDYLESLLAELGEPQIQHFEGPGGEKFENLVLVFEGDSAGSEWIVLAAHYDHLGRGEAGDANAGQIHFGADDNASGVAVVLEVARALSEPSNHARGVVVLLTSAEEEGLLGARAFLDGGVVPASDIRAMVNLDTVGRLADGGLTVFGVESSRVFEPALHGLNTVYRFGMKLVPRSSGASDDAVFAERGIPSLHLFTGAHATYHRPGDVVEALDFEGLRDLADFTYDLVEYLQDDTVDLSFVPSGAAQAVADPQKATEGKRRVSFGSIPDFQFAGPGVKITGVLPGSPAAEAGLQADDVIVEFAGAPVEDLTDYSEAMKRHEPGEVVEVVFLRGGERTRVEVTLVARQ